MQVNSINNFQNFQARIKINKNNLANIASAAGLGTTAAASIALQSDFDYGMSQQFALGSKENNVSDLAYSENRPEWSGSTFDFVANASAINDENTEPGSPERTNGLIGAMGSYILSSQLSGYSGCKSLESCADDIKNIEMDDTNKKLPS